MVDLIYFIVIFVIIIFILALCDLIIKVNVRKKLKIERELIRIQNEKIKLLEDELEVLELQELESLEKGEI